MNIKIINGRIIDPNQDLDTQTSLFISQGKILSLTNPPDGFQSDKTIDAKGCLVIPGLIDIFSSIRNFVEADSCYFQAEINAIARSGVTSFVCSPEGKPIIDNVEYAKRFLQSTQPTNINIYPLGALTTKFKGENVTDLNAMQKAGCIGFSNCLHPIYNLKTLRTCYELASTFNCPIFIQPLDYWLAKNGVVHEGEVSCKLGLPAIPSIAESIAIEQHLALIEDTGIKAHFLNITSAKGVELIAKAKEKGLEVTASTSMYALHLNETHVLDLNANCFVLPPLRTKEDQIALQQGLKNGTLSALSSHHTPLKPTAKLNPFEQTTPGMSTIDTFLPLGLKLVEDKIIDLKTLIKRLTLDPAKILNLNTPSLKPGANANICIVDNNAHWVVASETLKSQGHNTAFFDWELPGVITHTIVQGKII